MMTSINIRQTIQKLLLPVILSLFISLAGCSSATQMLNRIPVNSVEVKVLNQNEEPIKGAVVQASNNRKTTTNSDGLATLRFGSVGVHYIGVIADNHMPTNFAITMPVDDGKSFTTYLTDRLEFNSFAYSSANIYPLLFSYLFSSYGYSLELDNYKAGQWTRWSITTGEDSNTMVMQKAFLKKLENGQEWWQIQMEGNDDRESYTAEILFSADRNEVLRYREQIGTGEIVEKPVSRGWYVAPVKLTEESKQGAVQKEEVDVKTPGGSFQADLLEFGVSPNISLTLWKTAAVPGALVKYRTKQTQKDELLYQSELLDYGSDAQTILHNE